MKTAWIVLRDMNNRYKFLTTRDEYEVTNLVRDAFLSAKNGQDVNSVINGLLTTDEMIKIGRRIQIASMLRGGSTGDEIKDFLKVGKDTITLVAKHLARYPECFELISERKRKMEKEVESKKYKKHGGSTLWHKKKEYTGFTRKDVKR